MSEWSLSGSGVIAAELSVPQRGPWVLRVDLDREEDLVGPIELAVGEARWRGAVARGGAFEGRWRGWVVGGAGGLAWVLPARFYRSVPARLVVRDLVADVGEQLADGAPGLDAIVPVWPRRAERADAALSRLLAALGLGWRVLPSGAITTAPWPTSPLPETAQRIHEDPRAGAVTFGVEDLALLPGTALDDGVVRDVVFTLNGAVMRAEVSRA